MFCVLAFLTLYIILSIRRLDLAVMFLIAALPAYLIRFDVLGMPATLLEAMILIAFSIWLIKNAKQIFYNIKSKIKNQKSKIYARYPFDIEIVLLLIVSFAAAGVAGFSALGGMGIWKAYFFEPALVFILVFNVGLSPLTPLAKGGSTAEDEGSIVPLGLWSHIANRYKQFALRLHSPAAAGTMEPPVIEINGVEKILWPLAISAFVVSVFAIYQKFTGAFIFNELWAAEETRRVTSFFGYPNAVGLYLGPITIVMTGWLTSVILRAKPEESQVKGGEYSFIKKKSKERIITDVAADQRSFTPLRFVQDDKADDKVLVIFVGIVIILSLLSIYFAKSEGAMIGIAAGLLVFGLLAGKKIRLATVILIFVAGVGIIMFQPLRDYAVKKITLTDLSGEIRKQQWRETWQMLTASPLRFALGAGLANYQNAVAPHHQEGIFFNIDNDPEFHRHVVWNEEYKKSHWQPTEIYLYPHNIIFNFWSELGLVGMVLFIWIIGKFFVIGIWDLFGHWSLPAPLRSVRPGGFKNLGTEKNRYIVIGLIGAMIVVVVHGLVDVPYFKNDLAVMFWLLIAMMSFTNLEKNYGENL
ncbi:MAG: O-antigen ligase family protein [bacterium]|nr:O-antigen ligase family protein [bacterium]